MPLVHECAASDCHVVTMGAFCIDHEHETFPLAAVASLERMGDTAAQSRAGGLRPTGSWHRYRSLRAVPSSPRLAARPR